MAFKLKMTLKNPGSASKTVTIHSGTVFEVLDPFSKTQNLVAAAKTTVVLPAGQTQVVEIATWCLNRPFSPPQNTPMQPTILATVAPYDDQNGLWSDMQRRR